MKADGLAQLRLVPKGARKSLEDVVEETRLSPRWAAYFQAFHDSYLQLTQEQYAALAEHQNLRIVRTRTADKCWDFHSRPAFAAFCSAGCIAWPQHLPESKRPVFIADVLDRYQFVTASPHGSVFEFYQMGIALSK